MSKAKQTKAEGKKSAKLASKSVAKTKDRVKEVPVAVLEPATLKKDRLLSLNKWLAIALGLQALALVLLSANRLFPVTIHFLGMDTLVSQAAGQTVYTPATRHLFDVSLAQILGLALAISAAAHGILARWLSKPYLEWIKEGSNPIRWLDGAFSASLLPVAIGLVAGLADVASLVMIFVLGFATHLLGLYMESYNQKHTSVGKPVADYRPFILLCITGVTAWVVLGTSILSSVIFGHGLPPGVWIAYIVGVLCAIAYLLVMVQGYHRKSRWASYRNSEVSLIVLSFIAKSSIAWLLFSAVLKP